VIVDLLEKLYSTAHLSCFARLLQREPVDLTVHSGTSVIAMKKAFDESPSSFGDLRLLAES